MPAKFDRCVRKVKARSKGRGKVNAYAVCTVAGTRDTNPGYGRHLDDDYAPIALYKYFTSKQGAQQYLRLQGWSGGVEHKSGGWPGARSWVAGEEYRVKIPDGGTRLIDRKYNPPSVNFGSVYGDKNKPSFYTPDGPLWMYRKGQKVRFYNAAGTQVGPEHSNVAPATAYALSKGWDPDLYNRRSNPESSAAGMYESFHGAPSEEVLEYAEEEHYHGNLAGLGVLVELKLVTTTGYDVTLSFSDPETLVAANPGIWDRLKRIGSKSTVYHMPKQSARMTKSADYKGFEIFKTLEGDYRVPRLEKESSFDSLADAKKFVNQWVTANGKGRRKNKGPFQSASRLLSSTGKYLDDQLGKALNPRAAYYVTIPWSDGWEVKSGPYRVRAQAEKVAKKAQGEMVLTYKQVEALDKKGSVKTTNWSGWSSNPGVSLDPALLCSNESGTQLYLQGGDQSVPLSSIHMSEVPTKDSMVLGEAYFVSYFTEKDFDDHKPTIYEHDIAEESDPPYPKYRKDEVHTAANRRLCGQGTGLYPTVRYDTLNQKLYLDGGVYFIKKPLMGTSPGIEN